MKVRYFSCFDPVSGNPSKTLTPAVPFRTEEKTTVSENKGPAVIKKTRVVEGFSNLMSVRFPDAQEITKEEYDAIDTSQDSEEFKKDRLGRETAIAELEAKDTKVSTLKAKMEAAKEKIAIAKATKEIKDKKPK